MNPPFPQPDTAETRLQQTFFLVEATSFEQFTLWQSHSNDNQMGEAKMLHVIRDMLDSVPANDWPNSDTEETAKWLTRHRRDTVDWEQIGSGWVVCVGELAGRDCYISVNWARIEGQLVMFWYECSGVSDHLQTEAWLKSHFPQDWRDRTCDASNFHQCVNAIRRMAAHT